MSLLFIIMIETSTVWDVENENERPTIPQFQKNWDNTVRSKSFSIKWVMTVETNAPWAVAYLAHI
jgi:hypothetical protein